MKQLIATFLFTLFLTNSLIINAQTNKSVTVVGKIVSQLKNIESANISLLKAKDSSIYKMAITNQTGDYEFMGLLPGKYFLQVQVTGFEKFTSNILELSNQTNVYTMALISLQPSNKDLGNVTVVAKKQFVEQKLDKTIINVDALASNAGATVLEILEKSPGVAVDKDGNISLKGKQGVMVLIDGRPTYLGGQDLANMLKNMPGGNLDIIEIMTNPPAKYDAAGNSGIINIKTKKSKTVGLNGSVSSNYSQGVYPKFNNSINLNYKKGKFNFFGNFGSNYNQRFQDFDIVRTFRDKNTSTILSVFEQFARSKREYNSFSYKAGADYFYNKKTTFGIVVNGFQDYRNELTNSQAFIKSSTGFLNTFNKADNSFNTNLSNIAANVNVRHIMDTLGSEITADVDYINYNASNTQFMNNYFFDAAGNTKAPEEKFKSQLPSNIHIYSAKTDYSHPLNKTSKIEAGLKFSYVETDNNALFENWNGINWEKDVVRSNQFIYKENINAAYVNYNKQLNKKWSIQTGLRLENTQARGNQITTGQKFDRNYTQLFPTVYIGLNANEKNQFSLNYGRRIDRPDYEDLNPFYNFLDKYTFQVGNPFLNPQFSHNIELSHTFGGFLTTTLNYSNTKNIIQDVIDQVDSINTTFIRKDNIAQQQNFGIAISANVPITKWWKANIYTNVFNNQFSGLVNGSYLSVSGATFTTNITNQFTIKKGFNAELSGFYRSSELGGVLISKPMGGVNIAFTKQVLKTKGTLRIGVRDVFFTQVFNGYSRFQNIDITVRAIRDSRVLNIGFTYRFGKAKPTQNRKRGGAGDEQDRVKGGAGN